MRVQLFFSNWQKERIREVFQYISRLQSLGFQAGKNFNHGQPAFPAWRPHLAKTLRNLVRTLQICLVLRK